MPIAAVRRFWLDDAITDWNKANPASPIQFMDIKDSYVWYSVAGKPELSSKDIRRRVYNSVYKRWIRELPGRGNGHHREAHAHRDGLRRRLELGRGIPRPSIGPGYLPRLLLITASRLQSPAPYAAMNRKRKQNRTAGSP